MADESQTNAANPARLAPGSFDAFVSPHLMVLLRVARSLCRSADDAEDLVQDTPIRAYRGLSTFDGVHPRTWLLTVMRNANINSNRRQRPGLLRDTGDLVGETDRRNPPSPSAEDVATAHLAALWIVDALRCLSIRHRQVVQLVDIDGLSCDEAAVALGIPTGTVMSRLHCARHRIRGHLTHHPDFRSEPR